MNASNQNSPSGSSSTPEAQTPEPVKKPAKKRSWRKRIVIFLVAILVFVGVLVALLPTILSSDFATARVTSLIEARLNGEVDIADVDLAWGGSQQVTGLRVGAPSGYPDQSDIVDVPSATIQQGLWGLAFGSDPIVVEVTKPVLRVHRTADGRSNVEELIKKDDGAAEEKPPETEPDETPEKTPAPIELPRDVVLRVQDASLHLTDEGLAHTSSVTGIATELTLNDLTESAPATGVTVATKIAKLSVRHSFKDESGKAGKPLEIDDRNLIADLRVRVGATPRDLLLEQVLVKSALVNVDAKGSASGAGEANRFVLTGDASLRLPELTAAHQAPAGATIAAGTVAKLTNLSVDATVGGEVAPLDESKVKGDLALDGRVEASGLWLEDLTAKLAVSDGRIAITETKGTINKGRMSAPAVTFDTKDSSYSINAELVDLEAGYQLAPLLSYALPVLSNKAVEGAFTGLVEARINLKGKGFSLAEISKSLIGEGALRIKDSKIGGSPVLDKIGGLLGSPLQGLLVSQMGSDFQFAGGKLDAAKVFLQPKDTGKIRNLGLKGATFFDGRLDYAVDMAAVESSIGDKKIRRAIAAARAALGTDSFPLKLTGTLTDPEVALELGDIKNTVGSLLKDKLESELGDKLGDAIGEQGSELLEGLGLGGKKDGAEDGGSDADDDKSSSLKEGVKGVLDLIGGDKKD